MSDLPTRDQLDIGMTVAVELKKDQGSGRLTEGKIVQILTNANSHPHGIMVRLEDDSPEEKIGRVKQILDSDSNNSEQTFHDFKKTLEEIENFRRQTTPQYQVKQEPLSTKKYQINEIAESEDQFNEFKKTFKFDSKEKEFRDSGNIEAADGRKKEGKKIENAIKKEISIAITAFANSMGGKLFIGVDDDGNVVGLDDDLKSYKNFDEFIRAVQDSVTSFTDDRTFVSEIVWGIGEDNKFLVAEVEAYRENPIYIHDGNESDFYIRGFGKSDKMSTPETVKYIQRNFNQS